MRISDLDVWKIENGAYYNELPEFYKLKNCIENNSGHNNDSVFNHSINSVKEYNKFLKNNKNSNLDRYFNQKIDEYTRRELLFVSILFHDIAKPETIVMNNGITSCLNHEELGSKKVKDNSKIFKLSKLEEKIVMNTIKYHALIHKLIKVDSDTIDKDIKYFSEKYFFIFLELVVVALVDIRGSQLKENNFQKFYIKDSYYNRIINEF